MVALLGLINLIAGFLPEVSLPASARQVVQSTSVFAVGPGWVPLLLLIGGLLAAAAFLPGGGDHRYACAAVSVAGAVGAVVALGVPNGFEELLGTSLGNGAGALLLFIGGTIQAVVAVAALVLSTNGPRDGVFFGGSSGPSVTHGPAGPGSTSAAGPQGTWSAGPSSGGAPHPFAGPVPWSAGPASSASAGGPVPGPPAVAGSAGTAGWAAAGTPDDLRVTGPIPPVGPHTGSSAQPVASSGDRVGRHWAERPDDATVSTRAQDRPGGGDTTSGR